MTIDLVHGLGALLAIAAFVCGIMGVARAQDPGARMASLGVIFLALGVLAGFVVK